MSSPKIRGLNLDVLPQNYPQPSHFNIENVIRNNILSLEPYRCARDDYDQGILLDANENSLGSTVQADQEQELHRYPSPSHPAIKESVTRLRSLPSIDYVFLGVGSDEVIDLLYRVCCTPSQDKALTCPPTYGMYGVCAVINDVQVEKIPLDVNQGRFQLDVGRIQDAYAKDVDNKLKLTFICSPGNPTGSLINLKDIITLLEDENNNGLIVVDEAYIDFSDNDVSAVQLVEKYSNLIVMQTLSKSFGLAGIRLGIAIAQPPLIQVLSNTKAPYNISTPTAKLAEEALSEKGVGNMKSFVAELKKNRDFLISELSSFKNVDRVIGSNDANFVMLPILNDEGKKDNEKAKYIYKHLAETDKIVNTPKILVDASKSLPEAPAQRLKASTRITGLAVHPDPLSALAETYSSTLSFLQQFPSSSVYKNSVEALTKQRLSRVVSANDKGVSPEDVEANSNSEYSDLLGTPPVQLEEVLVEAENELGLAAKMFEWKAWEPLQVQPPKDQWKNPFSVDTSKSLNE
ncbi:hypothetical protein E3P81_03086 [Wallemia ichthyophaga]|nr:hypothetical protein E3P97_03039 [Wallemia ichthyophaga]TIB30360.1 hypothetical protein E3P85_02765 [Wallemia ichthyophaga]TIB45233.1 hypothetical protein E3P82_02965 [Wallemia ichthyophaga]TIB47921.1 hypothetical protein E3P81_03086 [Wallemia ichthyophaga]TIB51554.1 hypothetical protein E3P80_02970 [Wallemia ichthyophaga]